MEIPLPTKQSTAENMALIAGVRWYLAGQRLLPEKFQLLLITRTTALLKMVPEEKAGLRQFQQIRLTKKQIRMMKRSGFMPTMMAI